MASDGDIHFPPGQRRGKPSFEPPPWERDQFEELARRKQTEGEAQAGGVEALTQGERDARPDPVPEEEPPPEDLVIGGPSHGESPSTPVVESGGALDEKQVEVLMMGLRAEEPRPEQTYWRIVAGSGVVSILVGLMITTWAVVMIVAPKQAGGGELLFEAMLLTTGLGFIAGGLWVIFKSLRQQGVL